MDITKNLRDAAYIIVGLGVIGIQKAQVRRVELRKQLEQADIREQVAKLAKDVDDRIEPLVEAVDQRLDVVEERLPEQVREVLAQARKIVKDARHEVVEQLTRTSA